MIILESAVVLKSLQETLQAYVSLSFSFLNVHWDP